MTLLIDLFDLSADEKSLLEKGARHAAIVNFARGIEGISAYAVVESFVREEISKSCVKSIAGDIVKESRRKRDRGPSFKITGSADGMATLHIPVIETYLTGVQVPRLRGRIVWREAFPVEIKGKFE